MNLRSLRPFCSSGKSSNFLLVERPSSLCCHGNQETMSPTTGSCVCKYVFVQWCVFYKNETLPGKEHTPCPMHIYILQPSLFCPCECQPYTWIYLLPVALSFPASDAHSASCWHIVGLKAALILFDHLYCAAVLLV